MRAPKQILPLLGLLALAGCTTVQNDTVDPVPTKVTVAAATAERPTQPAPPAQQPAPRNHDCWYFDATKERLLAVWISPRLSEQVPGGFRFVNLCYHNVASPRPILLHSRPVRATGRDPFHYESQGRSFTIKPKADKTWAKVQTREDLEVTFNDS